MASQIWEVVYFASYSHLLCSPACCNSVKNVSILYSCAEISRWAGSLLQTCSSKTVRKMHQSIPQDTGGHGLCIENRSKTDTHVIVSVCSHKFSLLLALHLFFVHISLHTQDPQYFTTAHSKMGLGSDHNLTTLRLLYYPPLPPDIEIKPGQLRCGEHVDYGSITLLFREPGGGLQVLDRTAVHISKVIISWVLSFPGETQ